MSNLLLSDISQYKKLDKKLDMNDETTIFIKSGIETLVTKIIEKLDCELIDSIESLCDEFTFKNPNFHRCDVHGQKMLKVGSFYEDTKIIFPDEFDFIYIISAFRVKEPKLDWMTHYFTLNKFHNDIKRVIFEQYSTEKLVFESEHHCLKFKYYDKNQGPSSRLLFIYENRNDVTHSRSVSTDIVPAFQIFDDYLREKVKAVCKVEGFVNEVMQAKTYLITNEISFTEAELQCMKYTLSDEHRSVYRVLKYIINGDGDGEELRKNVPSAGISTYIVKVATIKHHFSCSGYYKESECLIDILHILLTHCERNFGYDTLFKFNGSMFKFERDDQPAILNWLRYKIQKYGENFSKVPDCTSDSSTASVTLSKKIQCDRESLKSSKSGHSSCSTKSIYTRVDNDFGFKPQKRSKPRKKQQQQQPRSDRMNFKPKRQQKENKKQQPTQHQQQNQQHQQNHENTQKIQLQQKHRTEQEVIMQEQKIQLSNGRRQQGHQRRHMRRQQAQVQQEQLQRQWQNKEKRQPQKRSKPLKKQQQQQPRRDQMNFKRKQQQKENKKQQPNQHQQQNQQHQQNHENTQKNQLRQKHRKEQEEIMQEQKIQLSNERRQQGQQRSHMRRQQAQVQQEQLQQQWQNKENRRTQPQQKQKNHLHQQKQSKENEEHYQHQHQEHEHQYNKGNANKSDCCHCIIL